MSRTILVTGGAGFIGGCFVRRNALPGCHIVVLDKLTYAGSLQSLADVCPSHFTFVHGEVGDGELIASLLNRFQPQAIVHFAAETHVDRSIDGPLSFVETNVLGTAVLLEAARRYWNCLHPEAARLFRLLHISTDEVYGSLGPSGQFTETSPYAPRSPYSASKASSDHLVRAWFETYRLPVIISNCSNNYGPYQFPEKLIPLMILNAIDGLPLPVYGDGQYVRDWLFVEDHCNALELILENGKVGETYTISGDCELTNLHVIQAICQVVQESLPQLAHRTEALIRFVADRPGHDRRYSLDASKIKRELHWAPRTRWADGLGETVRWYIEHREWVEHMTAKGYSRERLGEI